MDKLKQFINNNREAFDVEELPAGHELRFNEKLPNKQNSFRQYSLYVLATVASAALLIILIFPFLSNKHSKAPKDPCSTASDIKNLRLYYNIQMNEVIEQMEAFDPGNNKEAKRQLLEESARVMAASKLFEENVIPKLPCSEEALYAMTQHYSTSLQSLNFMLEQMEDTIDF